MVVIFAHFVPFWIKKGIFTRVEPSGDAPQWPPEVLPVLRHTNHSHKILGGSKKRFFEYLGWANDRVTDGGTDEATDIPSYPLKMQFDLLAKNFDRFL